MSSTVHLVSANGGCEDMLQREGCSVGTSETSVQETRLYSQEVIHLLHLHRKHRRRTFFPSNPSSSR